jgi:acyl-[acyl-carrier-protein]-phospholipid O-acyltransferase/long-chain-fatty-acid--[acyl-carrier-protein] ligase
MSFAGYLLMTLLTSVNDSLFRWLLVPVARLEIGLQHPDWKPEDVESFVLAMGLGIFTLPFVLFAPWAGWISDRFSKRTSILMLKLAEIVLVSLGVWAIQVSNVPMMFFVLFLIGFQAAMIGTAKLGIIPEIVRRSDISAANGWSGLATLVGVILGTVVGYGLGARTQLDRVEGLAMSALALIGTAILGTAGAMMTQRVSVASPQVRFQWNLIADSLRDIRLIFADREIVKDTMGIVF